MKRFTKLLTAIAVGVCFCRAAVAESFVLPNTGGLGSILFTVGGVILLGLAILILLFSKKKK